MTEPLNESGSNDKIYQNDSEKVNVTPMSQEKKIENVSGSLYYGLDKVSIFYLIFSILYIISALLIHLLKEDIIITAAYPGGLFLFFLIIFIATRNSIDKDGEFGCSPCLFILFSIFKLGLFFYLSYLNMIIFVKSSYFSLDSYGNEFLFAPHILFSNVTLSLFYIALIIYSNLANVKLIYVFLIGVGASLIAFSVLFPVFDIVLAGIVIGIVLLEVVVLVICVSVANKNALIEKSKSVTNVVVIDYYKFLPLMVLCYVLFIILLYIVYFIMLLISACLKKGKPKYVDEKGHVYDQCHHKMGITLPRKAKSVDKDGKFYDEFDKEIKPNSDCQIF